MAVRDEYVNSSLASNDPVEPIFGGGTGVKIIIATMEIAAADDNASILRVVKGISSDRRLVRAEMFSDTITGCNDVDFGVYKTLENASGVVINVDCFLNGGDPSGGLALGSGLDMMSALDVANFGKRIWENAGESVGSRTFSIDLALTFNVIGSGTGTITTLVELV